MLAGCTASPTGGGLAPASATGPDAIHGENYRLEPVYLVSVHVPNADVDKVLVAIVAAAGLPYGKYDQVAFIDAAGLEQFRQPHRRSADRAEMMTGTGGMKGAA